MNNNGRQQEDIDTKQLDVDVSLHANMFFRTSTDQGWQ